MLDFNTAQLNLHKTNISPAANSIQLLPGYLQPQFPQFYTRLNHLRTKTSYPNTVETPVTVSSTSDTAVSSASPRLVFSS